MVNIKLRLTVLLLSLVSLSFGKPQDLLEKVRDRANQEAAAHFGSLKDFEDVNIPMAVAPFDEYNSFTNDGSGNYNFGYNTFSNGIQNERYEIGELKYAGTDNEIQTVRGQYLEQFVVEDGSFIISRRIGYVADEKGYRPFVIDVSVYPVMGIGVVAHGLEGEKDKNKSKKIKLKHLLITLGGSSPLG